MALKYQQESYVEQSTGDVNFCRFRRIAAKTTSGQKKVVKRL
jgi:hypothetical protein